VLSDVGVCVRVCVWLRLALFSLTARPSSTTHTSTRHTHTHQPTHQTHQIGNDCPDVAPAALKAAWGAVQALVRQGLVSAGHDVSDGGLATTLLEMAFAGGCAVCG
jgi:phosphoribosylformylglycinamidine (FGAM) synthase-like enzyme